MAGHTKNHARAHVSSHVRSPTNAPSAPVQPSEFITNGAFAADTNWTKGAGWTIAGGVAAHDGLAASNLTQTLTTALIAGNNYTYSFDVVNTNGALVSLRVLVGGNIQTIYNNTPATGNINGSFTASHSHNTVRFTGDDVAALVSLDNVSIAPAA